jgi:23S rRNA (cytidine1920-2'-O)/16S rRNA (cytidine1409-2'-O)-methyltransferase
MAQRERLDVHMVARGLAESRSRAQRMVMAGQVSVDGQTVLKPSRLVSDESSITIAGGPRYVSRGGDKLAAALEAFPVSVRGRICADVGASTGGFTDCLLQHGAGRVYAIDVGHGILHYRLRSDPRVVLLEKTNARKLASLPEAIGLTTLDASFISLRVLLPVVRGWLEEQADVIALVKPQFEAGKELVGRGGVVRKPEVHRQVLDGILSFCESIGLAPQGLIRSPLLGPKGNVEFLLWCHSGGASPRPAALIEGALEG